MTSFGRDDTMKDIIRDDTMKDIFRDYTMKDIILTSPDGILTSPDADVRMMSFIVSSL